MIPSWVANCFELVEYTFVELYWQGPVLVEEGEAFKFLVSFTVLKLDLGAVPQNNSQALHNSLVAQVLSLDLLGDYFLHELLVLHHLDVCDQDVICQDVR